MHELKICLPLKISLLIFWIVVLTSCSNHITVHDETANIKSQPLLEHSPEYGYAPVWLNENDLFLPSGDVPNFQGGAIYNLATDKLQALQPKLDLECFQGDFYAWSRLPDGRLGFLYECRDENTFLVGEYLIAWDNQKDQYEILTRYVVDSFPGGAEEYAIAREFDELIQESNGGGIMHRLYRASLNDGEIIQLFPNLYRAGSPSWSPNGEEFVFAGNDSGSRLLKSIFAGYLNLRNEIYQPWNLYIVDGNGENLQEILSGIRFVDTVKWSPRDKQFIAFRGEYENRLGLWLFDLDSKALTFLWPESERRKLRFDWSPDGTKLVVMDCIDNEDWVDDEDSAYCRPTIIEKP